MSYTIEIDKAPINQWDSVARVFSDRTIYQASAYQQTRAEKEKQALSRVVIYDLDNKPVLMCIVRIKKIPLLNLRIGYVQWGPLIAAKGCGWSHLQPVLEVLRREYIPKIVDILRIVPNVIANEEGNQIAERIVGSGFESVKGIAPYHSIYVNVADGVESIRANLHSSWRRMLKKTERSDIEIREGNDISFFRVLEKMYHEAIDRKGFRGLDPDVFMETQEKLNDSDKIHIIVAFSNNEPVCAHASSYLGEMGEGILAASTEKGLSMCASYLVWWRTLLAAHRAQMKFYNLGGIDPLKNSSLHQFKTRMGGYEVFHIGAFEASSSAFHRRMWQGIDKVYRYIRS